MMLFDGKRKRLVKNSQKQRGIIVKKDRKTEKRCLFSCSFLFLKKSIDKKITIEYSIDIRIDKKLTLNN